MSPTPDEIRRGIEYQTCPWCGAGPFKALAIHIQRKHGLVARIVKDMAGMKHYQSVCSPEHSAAKARIARERAASETTEETSQRMRTVTNAIYGDPLKRKGWEAKNAAAQAMWSKLQPEDRKRILERWRAGETQAEIAADYAITQVRVSQVLGGHRHSVDPSEFAAVLAAQVAGESQRAIGERYGVSGTAIGRIVRGERKGPRSYI